MFFKNYEENEAVRLVPDLFFKKAYIEVNSSRLQLSSLQQVVDSP